MKKLEAFAAGVKNILNTKSKKGGVQASHRFKIDLKILFMPAKGKNCRWHYCAKRHKMILFCLLQKKSEAFCKGGVPQLQLPNL